MGVKKALTGFEVERIEIRAAFRLRKNILINRSLNQQNVGC